MADNRFFHKAGPFLLSDIAAQSGAVLKGADRTVSDVGPLESAGASEISFFDNIKYLAAFAQSRAGACFVRARFAGRAPQGMALLVTEEPYCAYALTAQNFYPDPPLEGGISPTAVVDESARLGEGVRIEPGVVIGKRAVIGARTAIGANSVIGDGVEIGSDCRIGPLCTVTHAVLGTGVTLHRGVHIGQDGFGFAPGPRGTVKVPQLGRVIIGDHVDIGSNSCIDRGAGPDTVIGAHSKIDNLVQIGHNVRLGKYVIITGQCGISGSTELGDGIMLGAQSGLAGHLRIGAGAKLAARSGLMHDVPAGETWGGTPAVPVREWHRQTLAISKLAKKKDE